MSTREIEEKWSAFLAKVQARIESVSQEAAAAFADVADVSPLDPAPIASIEGALQARFRGLSDKVDEAWSKIEDELGELPRTPVAVRHALAEAGSVLKRRIDEAEQRCRTLALARVGEALQALAAQEDRSVCCKQCGAGFDPGVVWQTTNVPCKHCGAINAVGPGPAALQWYSRGSGYLAEAAALDAWIAYRQAEQRFDALRHPTVAELDTLAEAYEAYHRDHTAAFVDLHPAWDQERADREVRGYVGKLRGLHRARESEMARTAEGLGIAGRRNPKLVEQWAASSGSQVSRSIVLDNLLEAAVERGLRAEAATLVQVVHKDELPWLFGRDRWVQSKLKELSASF